MRFAPSALLFKLRALRAEALSAKMIPEQLLYLRKRDVQYTKAVLLLGGGAVHDAAEADVGYNQRKKEKTAEKVVEEHADGQP